VRQACAAYAVNWVPQAERRGTGHAVLQAMPHIPDAAAVLVLLGDHPLVPLGTLREMAAGRDAPLAVLTMVVDDPAGYGRVVRDLDGDITAVVEERDATPEQRMINEVNTGIILAQEDENVQKKLNSMVFPGTQGGPLMHVIAAKAVAFKEALEPGFRDYQAKVIENARTMAAAIMHRGYRIVSGGTDNHLFLIDLIGKEYTGKDAEEALGRANITVNKNTVPGEPRSPFVTSGLRLGTPAITTRGFDTADCAQLAGLICDVLDRVADTQVIDRVRQQALELCRSRPVYGG
jgi:hypothetical protein